MGPATRSSTISRSLAALRLPEATLTATWGSDGTFPISGAGREDFPSVPRFLSTFEFVVGFPPCRKINNLRASHSQLTARHPVLQRPNLHSSHVPKVRPFTTDSLFSRM